jgi:hypothetical protein
MSSPTDQARKAVRQAGLAKALTWLAAALGVGFVVAFLFQAGLFTALLPDAPKPPPETRADQITATQSTVTGMDRQKCPMR